MMSDLYEQHPWNTASNEENAAREIKFTVATMVLIMVSGSILYQVVGSLLLHFNQALQQLTALPILPILTQLSSGCISILCYGVPLLAFRIILKPAVSLRSFIHRPNEKLLPYAVIISVGAFAMGAISTDISNNILNVFHIKLLKQEILIPDGITSLLLFLVNYILILPILEELLFRGIILHTFRRFGDLFALVISTLFYVIAQETYMSFLSTFLFGIVTGYFVLRSRSVVTGILMHISQNLLLVIMTIFTSVLDSQTAIITETILFFMMMVASVFASIRFVRKDKASFLISEDAKDSTLSLSERFRAALYNPAFALFAALFLYRFVQLTQIL